MDPHFLQAYAHFNEKLKEKELYRSTQVFEPILKAELQKESQKYISFMSNDYLGLSRSFFTTSMPVGSSSAPLLCGYHPIHQEVEELLASWKHTQKALLFPSGFQANVSIISALLDPSLHALKPLAIADKLIHNSMLQGIKLASCEMARFQHNHMEHLESILKKYHKTQRPLFIFTESVFSMDGDLAPLDEISHLSQKYGAFLYIDEAHATGVFGKKGEGLVQPFHQADLILGTFSKALGLMGGFACTSSLLYHYLQQKASGYIYSTSPSPAITYIQKEHIIKAQQMNKARENLFSLISYWNEKMPRYRSHSPIIPLLLNSIEKTLQIKKYLEDKNILVSAIRPPTVSQARLRLSLTASHKEEDLTMLIQTLKEIL